MATVYELGSIRLRARGGANASMLVQADGALYECVGLSEASVPEYTAPDWLELVKRHVEHMEVVTDEELIQDNADAPTLFRRGRDTTLERSQVFDAIAPIENFRVVAWDGQRLRLMFRYAMPPRFVGPLPRNIHVSMELVLAPVLF